MMKQAMQQLAERILAAVKVREGSWNGRNYTLTIEEAAIKVAGMGGHTRESHLVYILLTACWNDAIEWAKGE